MVVDVDGFGVKGGGATGVTELADGEEGGISEGRKEVSGTGGGGKGW